MRFMNCIRSAARQAIRRVSASGDGFTLIELIVVIAILGILIAIAVPTIRGFLESSREQAYEADRRIIQLAVDAYYYSPGNERFNNVRQYPIMGKRSAEQDAQGYMEPRARFHLQKCVGNSASLPILFEKAGVDKPPEHPVRGTEGGTPIWVEGTGDTIRNSPPQANEKLYCPGELSLEEEERADHWRADVWALDGSERCDPESIDPESDCVVIDSRDYLIDFCELVQVGFIEEIPRSASNDHDRECARGSGDDDATPTEDQSGSYTWYVDSDGKVQSLYYFYPAEDSSGYANAYP